MNQAALARAAAVVGADGARRTRSTKAIAVASLERGEEVNVFLGLDMTYVRNEGVAFGALSSGGPLLVDRDRASRSAGLVAYFVANSDVPFLWLPVGLILGGALGNLADRARDGAVDRLHRPDRLAGLQSRRRGDRRGRARAGLRGGG